MNIYDTCPACSSANAFLQRDGVHKCQCEAIFGEIDAETKAKYVNGQWHRGLSTPEEESYFDFIVNGVRSHGWYHIHTKKITQIG